MRLVKLKLELEVVERELTASMLARRAAGSLADVAGGVSKRSFGAAGAEKERWRSVSFMTDSVAASRGDCILGSSDLFLGFLSWISRLKIRSFFSAAL